jgi:hypothetical protein
MYFKSSITALRMRDSLLQAAHYQILTPSVVVLHVGPGTWLVAEQANLSSVYIPASMPAYLPLI